MCLKEESGQRPARHLSFGYFFFVFVRVLVELRRKIKVIKLQRALRDVQMRTTRMMMTANHLDCGDNSKTEANNSSKHGKKSAATNTHIHQHIQ